MRPSVINGSSAGWPPSSVKKKKAAKNCQVMPFRIGSLAHLTDQRPLLKQGTTTTSTAATSPIILILTIMLGAKKRCFQSTRPTKTKPRIAPQPRAPPATATSRPNTSVDHTEDGAELRGGPEESQPQRSPTTENPPLPTSRHSGRPGV